MILTLNGIYKNYLTGSRCWYPICKQYLFVADILLTQFVPVAKAAWNGNMFHIAIVAAKLWTGRKYILPQSVFHTKNEKRLSNRMAAFHWDNYSSVFTGINYPARHIDCRS